MDSDKKRSPEVILEYFNLLNWNKNGRRGEISQETLDLNEQLRSIKHDLSEIQTSTTERTKFISSAQKEVESIKLSISAIERNLLSLGEKISLIQREIQRCIELMQQPTVFEQFDNQGTTYIQTVKLSDIVLQLLLSIGDDMRKIYLDLKQAIITLNIPVLLQYLLSVLLVVIPLSRFMYLVNYLFYMVIIVYGMWKLVYVFRHKKPYKQSNEVVRQQLRRTESLTSQFKKRKQELETNLNQLEQQYAEQGRYLNQQKSIEQELIRQVQEARNNLIDLAHSHERQVDNYQRKVEDITTQEELSKLERLKHLEKLTQQWLDQDIDRLTKRAMKKLKLIDAKHIEGDGVLRASPIRFLVGTTKRTSPSLLVEESTEKNVIDSPFSKLRIDEDELRSELSYDGVKKFGVYEFLVVFLCSNFLSYYKCYWNFIRAKSVDDKYCEYLYDSFVSIRIEEDSSLNRQDIDAQKQIYRRRLVIATNDGKTLCFQGDRTYVKNSLSSKLSHIDDAATEIRRMLRQRRIDYTVTNSLNDD